MELDEGEVWLRGTRLLIEHGLAGWALGFNDDLDRTGVCVSGVGGRPGRIELSRPYVQSTPWSAVRCTLLHEIAHALVGPELGHNEVWARVNDRLGGSGVSVSTPGPYPRRNASPPLG